MGKVAEARSRLLERRCTYAPGERACTARATNRGRRWVLAGVCGRRGPRPPSLLSLRMEERESVTRRPPTACPRRTPSAVSAWPQPWPWPGPTPSGRRPQRWRPRGMRARGQRGRVSLSLSLAHGARGCPPWTDDTLRRGASVHGSSALVAARNGGAESVLAPNGSSPVC